MTSTFNVKVKQVFWSCPVQTLSWGLCPSYIVCICIIAWPSVTFKNEVTVILTLNVNVKWVIIYFSVQNFFVLRPTTIIFCMYNVYVLVHDSSSSQYLGANLSIKNIAKKCFTHRSISARRSLSLDVFDVLSLMFSKE